METLIKNNMLIEYRPINAHHNSIVVGFFGVQGLGGESPLHGKMSNKVLAEGKGVNREVESEGSIRQNLDSMDKNYI